MSWNMPSGGNSKKKAIVTFKGGKVSIKLMGYVDSSCTKAMDKLTSHLKVTKHVDQPEALISQTEEKKETLIN
jgi:hypothetical protein